VFGWSLGTGVVRFLLAVGLPLAAAVCWGAYAAPRSARRLPDPQRFVFELGFFGAAAGSVLYLGWVALGVVFAVVSVANMILVRVLRGRSLAPQASETSE